MEVKRDEAELLFSIIHQESLIHHIYGSIRHQLLQVISESFASEIDPLDGVVEREVVEDGDGVSEGEATIHDEATLSPREDGPWLATSLVEMDE